MLHDSRRLDQAAQTAGLSLVLARKAGDRPAQAEAYDTLALIRTYGAAAAQAVEYAQRGLALDGLDDATRAMLLVRLARTLAVLPGQERRVRRAVDHAQDMIGWLSATERAEVMANSGIALDDCGLHALGVAELRSAASAVERSSPLLLTFYRARLAKSALKSRDVAATAQAMTALSRVVPLVTSRRVDIHVSHILVGSHSWRGVPEIRVAREQLAEVTG